MMMERLKEFHIAQRINAPTAAPHPTTFAILDNLLEFIVKMREHT
jgi:hypothetical protein